MTDAWPEMPDGIADRDADVWEPLLAIADAAGDNWPHRARVAAVALVALSKESTPSIGVRLLSDLRRVFGDRDMMTTESILIALHEIVEAPWGDIRGKPLNDRGLASRLRRYDIRPKVIRIDGTTPRGYLRADLVEAWRRYLPLPPHGTATSATSATNESRAVAPGEPESVTGVEGGEL